MINLIKTRSDKCPELQMFEVLGPRGIKLADLIESFVKMRLQNCLRIVGVPLVQSSTNSFEINEEEEITGK